MSVTHEDCCSLMNIDGDSFRFLQSIHMSTHHKFVKSELDLGFHFSDTLNGYIEDVLGQDLVPVAQHYEPLPADALAICEYAYDRLAEHYDLSWSKESWLKTCVKDGQALGATAVARHEDGGVAKYDNRLLIVVKAREGRTLHVYPGQDYDNPDFSHEIKDGDLIQFDESIIHELTWATKTIPGFDGCLDNWCDEHDGIPEEVLCWFVTVPTPLLPANL